MKQAPLIITKSLNDLLDDIKRRAEVFTPEWHLNFDDMDMASVLAVVFARMQADTFKSFNQLPQKAMYAFFDELQTSPASFQPALGYASFALSSSEAKETFLASGMQVNSDIQNENHQTISVRTMDDVMVVPAQIKCLYISDDKNDYMASLPLDSCELFSQQQPSLGSHSFYFGHPFVLDVSESAVIELTFQTRNPQLISILHLLTNPQIIRFSYSSEKGFSAFKEIFIKGHTICLKVGNKPAKALIADLEQYWICMHLEDAKYLPYFAFENIVIASRAEQLPVTCLDYQAISFFKESFYPFGREFSRYNEVYFCMDEALGKKRAAIELSFICDFETIIPESFVEEQPVNWKPIMKKSQFKKIEYVDVSIEEVVLEYFNGQGWIKLASRRPYQQLFKGSRDAVSQRIRIQFQCPKDMQKMIWGGLESYAVRLRILRINHEMMPYVHYLSPVLSDVKISYSYQDRGFASNYCVLENNGEVHLEQRYFQADTDTALFRQNGDDVPTLYMGFSHPLSKGPVRMLWVIDKKGPLEQAQLHFEYFDGTWKEVNMIDETNNLQTTGMMTFAEMSDMKQQNLFQQNCYWLRVRDERRKYSQFQQMPLVKSIHLNVSRVQAIEPDHEEYFTFSQDRSSVFQLAQRDIYDLELWVRETQLPDQEEISELQDHQRFRQSANENWVKWEAVNDLSFAKTDDRYYQLDKSQGVIHFGDGIHGRMPETGITNQVYVRYTTGYGKQANLAEHSLSALDKNVGFISEVDNPYSLMFGHDAENDDMAIERTAAKIRHCDRAVSASDYEKIVKFTFRNVEKVKCVAHRDETGKLASGHVSLVIKPYEWQEKCPMFSILQKEIYDYLEDKADPILLEKNRLHIIEPFYVHMNLDVEVKVNEKIDIYAGRAIIEKELNAFIDISHGNFNKQGFSIGEIPTVSQLRSVLTGLPFIEYIVHIVISYEADDEEINPESVMAHPYKLALAGNHHIKISHD